MKEQQRIIFHNELVKKLLKKHGIIEKGDFTLKSGKNSKIYISKHKIFANFELFNAILSYLTLTIMFSMQTENFDVILGPADGGTILAAALSIPLEKDFAFTSEFSGGFYLKSEYRNRIKNKRVLIIDDILTTGNTIKQTKAAIESAGGKVVGAVCIWNRSGEIRLDDMTVYSLVLERISE